MHGDGFYVFNKCLKPCKLKLFSSVGIALSILRMIKLTNK